MDDQDQAGHQERPRRRRFDGPDPDITETKPYTPLGERLNQDVIHDNFVPKYSALANAPRTKLVMAGVWLIFLPMSFGILALPMYFYAGQNDSSDSILSAILATAFGALAIVILWSQTQRYIDREVDD